ncbi:MAG TPA: Hsp20/alpha crystallin family protein [Acetobacteraceae bacterium]|nr:Hsp20/alpha crystallin family protein [Acetobacteraceae bacterium]
MSGTALQGPFGNRSLMRRPEETDPFVVFRREMGRLFDDVLGGSLIPGLPMPAPARLLAMPLTPRMEVSETDKEFRVIAELPGIDAQNVEISLEDDLLSIRAEKSAQQQDGNDRDYHVNERSYGTFSRYLRLPFVAAPNQVQASFKDGVLTITIAKPEEIQRKVHRIDVAVPAAAGGTGETPASQPGQSAGGQQQAAE